jgi:NTE family protein
VRWGGALALAVAWLLSGCVTSKPANKPLAVWKPTEGYRVETVFEHHPIGQVLLVLAFSGGGTRAATFSYGVMEELRDTVSTSPGKGSLLDEVDVISSVSGGSFTSAYYGLYGDRLFQDFEKRFLRRDVQAELEWETFRPKNWFRILERTEKAIDFYDREIFDHATFADLQAAAGRPVIQINSTDLEVGSPFQFVQDTFDPLCSDLSKMRIARAVAASSAVPVVFNPISIKNFAGTCGYPRAAWIDQALADPEASRRRFTNARVKAGYLDPAVRPYIHLVDGGVSDNLGLRGMLDGVLDSGGPLQRIAEVNLARPDYVVVIAVDADTDPSMEMSRIPTPPGLAEVLGSITNSQINRYAYETIDLMRISLQDWAKSLPPGPDGRPLKTSLIEVSFPLLKDPAQRKYFNSMPTSYHLSDEQVDRLIAAARTILRESPEFQQAIKDLGYRSAAP